MNSFYTRFSPPPSPGVVAKGGLTQQHFKDDCDLNNILKRYKATGVPPPVSPGLYADLTELPTSLAEAFDRVAVAQDWFDSLPSDVRQSFNNDPRSALRLLMSNPSAAVAAGLIAPSDVVFADNSKAAAAATPEPDTPKASDEPAVDGAGQSDG